MLFLLSSHFRSSAVSVGFDFNASHNNIIPLFPTSLPVFYENEKNELLIDSIVVLFLLCKHSRLSFVSVVFVLNTLLNDFIPLSPTPFPVDLTRMEKSSLLMDAICAIIFEY